MRIRPAGQLPITLSQQETLQLARPDGSLIGIQFVAEGSVTGGSLAAADDDAVFKLISFVEIEIPTVVGNVVVRATGRDLMLLARYQHSIFENTIPTSAAAFNDGFILWLGWPEDYIQGDHPWGLSRDAIIGPINVRITYAASTEYNANCTGVTSGYVYLSYVMDTERRSGRIALIPNSNSYAVESEQAFTAKPVNFAPGCVGALGVLLRQEDTSAAADRVDGLVTQARIVHSSGVILWEENLFVGRMLGLQWAKVDRTFATAATPQGLDGSVLAIFNRRLMRDSYWPIGQAASISLEFDSAATVRNGQTNVTPASGDKLHALALGIVAAG